MNWRIKLSYMANAIGDTANEDQVYRLVNWILENVGPDHWNLAAEICGEAGIWEVFTELRMRSSEMGVGRE